VWAERYDRELDDIFAAQDEVTEAIVAAIAPAVSHLERERVREARCSCASMGAWENYQRGLWHVYRYSSQDIATAQQLFECAIKADPQFAPAHAGQAYALFVETIWGFAPDARANLQRARQSAQRAVTLDARDAFAHLVLGRVLMTSGEVRAALAECRLALELNPNLASAHFGLAYALTLAGRSDEALESVDRAIRLSPYDPLMHAFVTLKSGMLVLAGRYDEALETARDAQRKPNCTAWAHLHEATALANLDRLDEAKAAMDKAHALQPEISMRWVRTLLPAEPGVPVDAYFEGMKRAGLKD
jgi:tetratricopeptide (TPR) repeat protein